MRLKRIVKKGKDDRVLIRLRPIGNALGIIFSKFDLKRLGWKRNTVLEYKANDTSIVLKRRG